MVSIIHRLVACLRDWWAVEDAEERIRGSGDVFLDPAYNSRYTGERRLQDLACASEDDGREPDYVDPPHLK